MQQPICVPAQGVFRVFRELFALEVLNADGFIVFTSYNGAYLGEDRFRPLWEELDRRGAVVLIHPNEPSYVLPNLMPASVLEFPFETTRTARSLIIAGVLTRVSCILLEHRADSIFLHDALLCWTQCGIQRQLIASRHCHVSLISVACNRGCLVDVKYAKRTKHQEQRCV